MNRGEAKPIANHYAIFKDLSAELKVQTDRLQQTLTTDLSAFNTEATRAKVGVVTAK